MAAFLLQKHLATLLDFRQFRWIGTLLGSEVAAVRSNRHTAWQKKHSHAHHFREVLIGLSGHGCYGWNGKVYPIKPGTVLLFDSGEMHDNGYPAFGNPCCHLWLHEVISGTESSVIWNHCEVRGHRFTLPPSLGPFAGPSVMEFWKSWDALRAQPSDTLQRARFLAGLSRLIVDLVFYQTANPPPSEETDEAKRKEMILHMAELIRQNLNGDLSLNHLARLAGYSKFHFLRLFRKYRRCSLREYIQKLKVQRAIELLSDGMKVSMVAQEMGFSSPAAFHRFFVATTGKRPSTYFGNRRKLPAVRLTNDALGLAQQAGKNPMAERIVSEK